MPTDAYDRMPVGLFITDHMCPAVAEGYLINESNLSQSVELLFPYPTSHLIACSDHHVGLGESLVCTMRRNNLVSYKVETNITRRAVVQRDDDVLTPARVTEHGKDIEQGMMKELQTWANLHCFSRKKRKEARNVIDTRWVHKFKREENS